nr:acylphosphatase [Zoogloeaceae bacterium]
MPDAHPHDATAIAYHLLIVGRVQGVGYRASAKAQAHGLGLAGWVRNLSSGDVEAVVAGAPEDVHAFVDWARRGPPNARVARIDISEIDIPAERTFVQRPNA